MTKRERQREASRRYRERHRTEIRARARAHRVHPEERFYARVLRGVTGAQIDRTAAEIDRSWRDS